MENVTKRFGKVVANNAINLELREGEILSLLGENGSGKTTLMNMLSGIYFPDEGQIYIHGKPVTIASPKDAFNYGIGMIHQHFKLVDVFTATENIVLGLEGKLDLTEAGKKVKEICDRVAVMEHGRVVEQGEVFNVFADPRQEITRSFIHTTSNLRKIEELIEEDSPVVQLKPGELIVRLSYIQRNVSEPLISTVSRKFDITLNIIFSDIAIVQNAPIGGTVAIISGEREQITQAIAYLIEKNVGVEVIKDARVSE